MTAAMKTPGVYIVERNAFPNSVVEVETAVPAFIGYTEKASNKGKPLTNTPWLIQSMTEYLEYFGGAPEPEFRIAERSKIDTMPLAFSAGGPQQTDYVVSLTTAPRPDANKVKEAMAAADAVTAAKDALAEAKEKALADPDNQALQDDVEQKETGVKDAKTEADTKAAEAMLTTGSKGDGRHLLYYSMLLFFQNGGSRCYVTSVGSYDDEVEATSLTDGIEKLVKEQEPTMVVVPEAVSLDDSDCASVQGQALRHCGDVMKNRFAILDVWGGARDRKDPRGDAISQFRNSVGANFLDFAAAYYPWVETTVVQADEVSFRNLNDESLAVLQTLLVAELELTDHWDGKNKKFKDIDPSVGTPEEKSEKQKDFEKVTLVKGLTESNSAEEAERAHKNLSRASTIYAQLIAEMRRQLSILPPSAGMAGIYTMVDNSRGVWKAPANVSLTSVTRPTVNITHDEQEDLNVTPQGKSINAIRSFVGEGVLVWGGRTLDGNSLDWRYVNVRRTMIMLEESIKLAAKAYVFEPNVGNTWVTIRSMISNFLTGIWKRGGLAGAVPSDAFSVHVGLGETMTPEDILEGILRVTVLVAISRPAEFIEITFQQQMQKS